MSLLGRFSKQPGETLDYDVDYSEWFSNRSDSPQSVQTVVEPGLTLVTSTLIGNMARIVVSGGTSGQRYKVTVRLTTSGGIVKEADFLIVVKEI